ICSYNPNGLGFLEWKGKLEPYHSTIREITYFSSCNRFKSCAKIYIGKNFRIIHDYKAESYPNMNRIQILSNDNVHWETSTIIISPTNSANFAIIQDQNSSLLTVFCGPVRPLFS